MDRLFRDAGISRRICDWTGDRAYFGDDMSDDLSKVTIMKTTVFTLAMLVIAGLTNGCQDSRVMSLEQRVTRLEQSTKQLESELKKNADEESNRRLMLQSCLADAGAKYKRNLVSNGIKQGNGMYSVAVPVLSEMRRQKQDEVEECKLLHSK